MVLPAGVAHSYRADSQDPWSIYWVCFGGGKAQVYAGGMSPSAIAALVISTAGSSLPPRIAS